jgi:hypothetical protein
MRVLRRHYASFRESQLPSLAFGPFAWKLCMARDEFSLRRFFHVAHAGSIAVGIIIGLAAGPNKDLVEKVVLGIAGGISGALLASLCFYLRLHVKDMAALQIPDEELNESEVVLLKSTGRMIHFKSGRPHRFWEGVGGRLFLTNEVLEFRAHRGQFWVYRLTIPLGEIARVTSSRVRGVVCGALRVERMDGSFELFALGSLRSSDNKRWASAIVAVQSASPFVDGGSFKAEQDAVPNRPRN